MLKNELLKKIKKMCFIIKILQDFIENLENKYQFKFKTSKNAMEFLKQNLKIKNFFEIKNSFIALFLSIENDLNDFYIKTMKIFLQDILNTKNGQMNFNIFQKDIEVERERLYQLKQKIFKKVNQVEDSLSYISKNNKEIQDLLEIEVVEEEKIIKHSKDDPNYDPLFWEKYEKKNKDVNLKLSSINQ